MLKEPGALAHASSSDLTQAQTPALVLELARFDRNVRRLAARMERLGVVLRPHMKTTKSHEVARRLYPDGYGPITVSTLKEAEYFAADGARDIVYGVGIAPDKIDRLAALRAQGVDVAVVLDTIEQADALARTSPGALAALVEIDCDGHRGGLAPDDPNMVAIARILERGGVEVRGVLAHAGESYACRTPECLEAAAEGERTAAVAAAAMLRSNGFECPVVSVGSTPTAHFARDLSGVTEVRAGVYMFFDLVMHGIGVCAVDDIALSVLATVIGHKPEKGWIMVDAGWMALSRDRGTASQAVDQGYGLVCDVEGRVYPDLLLTNASQEHGILSMRPGSGNALPELPIGSRVRILPNHACATGAQHENYHVIAPGDRGVSAIWPRMRGW